MNHVLLKENVVLCFCRFYIFYSKIFGGIAVAVAVMYGVDFLRRWKKKNFGNKRPKNAKSDSEGTDISHL